MTDLLNPKLTKKITWLVLSIGAIGVVLRFYRIAISDFFFFDEGLYLNLHRKYLELIAAHPAQSLSELFSQLYLCLRLALGEGKALWFFLSHLRVFFGGIENWFFPRILSAVAGSLTLGIVFLFARKLFSSRLAAALGVIILALLPSHVFYSRLGLQEGLCTLFFLAGIYFYLFPGTFGKRTFFSVAFLLAAYFCNYRLIIVPVLIFFCEMTASWINRERFHFRKYFWHSLTFIFFVFLIGAVDQGQNTVVTFAWMYYQAGLAKEQIELFNFLSYPYYLFRFEGWGMGALFFGNIYLVMQKQWKRLFPFFFVVFYMAVFSLTADKAARYLCVMLPFVAMAGASLLDFLYEKFKGPSVRLGWMACAVLLIAELLFRSVNVIQFHSDDRASIQYLRSIVDRPLVLSTQRWLSNLYTLDQDVLDCPKDFSGLVHGYSAGYRYLIVGPQAYISWTLDGKKFSPRLVSYLNFIHENLTPVKVFPHFNRGMLERFVFEHNDNLRRSLDFLKSDDGSRGRLYIYDIKTSIETMAHSVAARKAVK